MRALTLCLALVAGLPAYAQEAEAEKPDEAPAPEASDEPTPEEPAAADDPAAPPVGEGDEPAPKPDIIPSEPVRTKPEAPPAEPVAEPKPEVDIAALQARLEALEKQVAAQNADLTKTKLKLVPPDEFKLSFEGFYRTRAYVFNHLSQAQSVYDADGNETEYLGDARYMMHRFKLRPVFDYKGLAKVAFEMDLFGDPQFGLADAMWGDNLNLQLTPVFATDASFTNIEGTPNISPKLTRAWIEFGVPVGLVRVGRQPSHWGMGLLANSGDGFDDPFGENKFGSSFDRAIFATKPIAIAQTILGKDGPDIPLFAAVGVDRLVEEPLWPYYGYKCDQLDTSDDVANGGQCETLEDHDYVDEDRVPTNRGPDWMANQRDDVMQMVYVLIYRGEDVKYFGQKGDLTAGAYVVNRIQRTTSSDILIADMYLKAKNRGILVEFEGLTIQGETAALALPGAFDASAESPLYKKVNIWGYSGRVGVERPTSKFVFETGYASGDEDIVDSNFKIRSLHPDHNVGLILYEEVIARVTRNGWGDTRPLWSNGGVYNSRYIFPWAELELIDNWDVTVGGVMAWPDKPDGAFIQCREGEGDCLAAAESSIIGWEIDAGLKIAWHKHLRFALEGGYAKATDRLPLRNAGLNPKGNFFTVQSRMAWEF